MNSTYLGAQMDPMMERGVYDRLGQIKKTIYVDDPLSVSKKYVEYNVMVFLDRGAVTEFANVRAATDFSGLNDSGFMILEENEIATKGALEDANPPQNKNGSLVIVRFINGNMPYIAGALQHPALESTATKENGIHKYAEFRGFQETINKDGELEQTFTGVKTPDSRPLDTEAVPVTFKVGKTDTVKAEGGHSLVLFAGGLKLTLKDGTSLTVNSEDSSFSVLQKDGHKIEVTSAGIKAQDKDGASVEITDGSVTAKDKSGGTLKLADGKVGLGASSAELVDLVYQLANTLSTDTFAGFGAPAGQAAAYAQIALDATGIKGGI